MVAATAHSKDEVALKLAQSRFAIDPGLTRIFRVTSMSRETLPGEPIKFLEVNRDTVPAGILPLTFNPIPRNGIYFPSVIVEVTPEEYERIQVGALSLPDDWKIGAEYVRS